MKRIIFILIIIMTGLTAVQAKNTDPGKGFWTMEDDAQHPAVHIFKFYYDENHLLYQEVVDFEIDISQKDVQEKLNKLLAELVDEHEKESNKRIEFKYLASL